MDFDYWNNKLTTFPGLFFLNSFLYRLFYLFGFSFEPLNFFRAVNSILSFILIYLLSKFKFFTSERNTFIFQLIITIFPLNYFYNFLYYTDVISLFSIIFYYYINFEKYSRLSIFIVNILFILGRFYLCALQTK
jgi:alpha-1,2-glucosyltransferase